MTRDLGRIFKAYDLRGLYPQDLDEDAAARVGAAFTSFTGAPRVVVGRDMRASSASLASAFARGAASRGARVVDVGQVSTDALYYASGVLDLPGAMVTASHNPPEYNGFKLCRSQASPIGEGSGLAEIRALAEAAGRIDGEATVDRADILGDYAAHCRTFVDEAVLRPIRVAIDAGNGMAGKTVPLVFERLPFEVVELFFELDGTFPNHLANPIEPANIADLQAAVREQGCDAGIAFDGDADRMFVIDETGEQVSGSLTTALVAESILKKNPGEAVIYNLICSWTVPEVIQENGGRPIRSRVGHSFIKELMATTGAIFGGEHSGHYYFRDNYRADSGMIAALLVLEALSEADSVLSELLRPFRRYASSGEINTTVADQSAALQRLAETYSDAKQDDTDGLTVEYEDWWFNCRPSNTEPLLRLNLEARRQDMMEDKVSEVFRVIRGSDES